MPADLLYSAPCEQTPRAVLVEGAPCSPCLPTIQDRLPTGVSLKKMKWKEEEGGLLRGAERRKLEELTTQV
ncbi:unnamed protein product [Urochloa humidicola]